jgi:pimeloyl-ACP methyl ester carboxylesterase
MKNILKIFITPILLTTVLYAQDESDLEVHEDGTFWQKNATHPILDGQEYETPNRKMKVEYIQASDGIKFPVLISRPKNATKPLPALIAFPGSGIEGPWSSREFAEISDRGEAVVVMVGKRGVGPLPINGVLDYEPKVFKDDPKTLGDEANKVLERLKNLDYVDAKALHVCGISQGGQIAAQLANAHPEILSCHMVSTPLGSARDIFVFQNSVYVAPMFRLLDPNHDGKITKAEMKGDFDIKIPENLSPEDEEILPLNNPKEFSRMFNVFEQSLANFLKKKDSYTLEEFQKVWRETLGRKFDRMMKEKNDPLIDKADVEREILFHESKSASDLVTELQMPVHIWQGSIDATANPADFKSLMKRAEEAKKTNLIFHEVPGVGHGLIVGGASLDPLLKGTPCPKRSPLDQILDTISKEISKNPSEAVNEHK